MPGQGLHRIKEPRQQERGVPKTSSATYFLLRPLGLIADGGGWLFGVVGNLGEKLS